MIVRSAAARQLDTMRPSKWIRRSHALTSRSRAWASRHLIIFLLILLHNHGGTKGGPDRLIIINNNLFIYHTMPLPLQADLDGILEPGAASVPLAAEAEVVPAIVEVVSSWTVLHFSLREAAAGSVPRSSGGFLGYD